ncbi:unnamed protein product [Brassica oleracea]
MPCPLCTEGVTVTVEDGFVCEVKYFSGKISFSRNWLMMTPKFMIFTGIEYTGENSDAIRIPIDMIGLETLVHGLQPSNFVLPDNTALNSIDSLVNSTQVIARIKRPAGYVCPWQVDEDAFRWTIATMQLHDEEDACSYD